jgi:GT2 family glycosyltransferase
MTKYLNPISRICSFPTEIKEELLAMTKYERVEKDILIVVHNQLPYIQTCIESIRNVTKDYNLYVWDNASEPTTREWLEKQRDVRLFKSSENLGFIVPNNRMAEQARSPYLILLNSDTKVHEGWDAAMIAYLQAGYAQVGYLGGYLDWNGFGAESGFGDGVDYITGWCFAMPRAVYQSLGLFDETNLSFAYCEDADLSLRLREAGFLLRALHLGLVFHYENRTIKEVAKVLDCQKFLEDNHLYLRNRWKSYLPVQPAHAQKSP